MRSHIGFERLWSMKIPVPYSLFVRDGDFGWSCGQCPLDRLGQVVAPSDPLGQSELVVSYCCVLLGEAGFDPQDLRMAVVYHDLDDPAQVLSHLATKLGSSALLVPVRVPAFYYAGMLIEVDLFAMKAANHHLRFVTGGHDRPSETPLLDHWVATRPNPGLPSHAILDPAAPDTLFWALMPDHPVRELVQQHGHAKVRLRQSGPWHALTATAPGVAGLVPQTAEIMQAFAAVMAQHGLGFPDVVKSTTHYVGAATEAELHDNMAVRNLRYSAPGPASTGVRVTGLAEPGALTAITLLLHTGG
jgi:enamine deaminase RidA (YjgF/YER057c/UK114 family)